MKKYEGQPTFNALEDIYQAECVKCLCVCIIRVDKEIKIIRKENDTLLCRLLWSTGSSKN